MSHDSLLIRILEIESKAARIEGIFIADPELGRMWRAQTALTEACRSVGLEDIHVFEGDVVFRHLENRPVDAEQARGALAATGLLQFILSPGDITKEPDRVLTRCMNCAVHVEPDEIRIDSSEIATRLQTIVQTAPTPILAGLRASILFRQITCSRMPSADRLVFMAADHAARGGTTDAGPSSSDRPDILLRKINACWIFTPSIVLTQDRFRIWSPGSDAGFTDLMEGLSRELSRILGAMPVMRRWRDKARKTSSDRHGKSRLRDLVDLAIREPILTSQHLRESLDISERASYYLMKEAEDLGILMQVTQRRSYRVWTTPMMAQTLRMRASRQDQQGSRQDLNSDFRSETGQSIEDLKVIKMRQLSENSGIAGLNTSKVKPGRLLNDAESTAREEAVLAKLDAAMAQADAVLEKYARPEPKMN